MKYLRAVGMMLSLAVVGVAVAPSIVAAKPNEEEASPEAPTKVRRAPVLKPRGLRFGMSPKQVIKVYDEAIERDFLPQFKKAQPGVQMERVENQVRTKQQAFRLSFTKLDAPPSALDATPYVGEFTYYNKEAFATIERQGKKRTLFFIRNKLWKAIDVYPLGASSKWGKSFEAAVERVDKILKKKGRRVEIEGERTVADWTDGKTYLQVVDWAKGEVAVVFIDVKTASKLASLRTNEGPPEHDIDPEVKDVLRNDGRAHEEPPPPEKKKDD